MANAIATLVVVFIPTLLGAAVLGSRRAVRWARTRRPPTAPLPPPIEQVAADLRRLHRRRHELGDQATRPGLALRTRALGAAYADVLTTACLALDVVPPRAGTGGMVSAVEIERVETDLRVRGLDVAAV